MTEYNSNGIISLNLLPVSIKLSSEASLDETRSRHADLLSLFQSQDALDKKLT
jgi:hypothetical protein